jgi:hypothetical protein
MPFPHPLSWFFLFQETLDDVEENIELTGHIINGQLELTLPTDREATIQTRKNQILVGNTLITVNLGPHPALTPLPPRTPLGEGWGEGGNKKS